MKTLILISFEHGKEVVVHEQQFAPEHPMFAKHSWPDVVLYHTDCYALMDWNDSVATYSITSSFNLE